MILADTSAWVEYDRGNGSPVDQRLTKLIADNDEIAVTEPVLMEVLAGARDESSASELRRLLLRFRLLGFDSVTDFEGAARIYRTCRRAGITPRGLIDCMIATVALRTGATLLAQDVDMARIADIAGIGLDDASIRG
ncbi:MAG: PIN domain nuclease [Trueperaceae bacterium]|nr:PIN domain nuclease [Trueperaceae bacterium]